MALRWPKPTFHITITLNQEEVIEIINSHHRVAAYRKGTEPKDVMDTVLSVVAGVEVLSRETQPMVFDRLMVDAKSTPILEWTGQGFEMRGSVLDYVLENGKLMNRGINIGEPGSPRYVHYAPTYVYISAEDVSESILAEEVVRASELETAVKKEKVEKETKEEVEKKAKSKSEKKAKSKEKGKKVFGGRPKRKGRRFTRVQVAVDRVVKKEYTAGLRNDIFQKVADSIFFFIEFDGMNQGVVDLKSVHTDLLAIISSVEGRRASIELEYEERMEPIADTIERIADEGERLQDSSSPEDKKRFNELQEKYYELEEKLELLEQEKAVKLREFDNIIDILKSYMRPGPNGLSVAQMLALGYAQRRNYPIINRPKPKKTDRPQTPEERAEETADILTKILFGGMTYQEAVDTYTERIESIELLNSYGFFDFDVSSTRPDFIEDSLEKDPRTSLSKEMRILLSRLPVRDAQGNVVKDDYGFIRFVDENLAYASILHIVSGVSKHMMRWSDIFNALWEEGQRNQYYLVDFLALMDPGRVDDKIAEAKRLGRRVVEPSPDVLLPASMRTYRFKQHAEQRRHKFLHEAVKNRHAGLMGTRRRGKRVYIETFDRNTFDTLVRASFAQSMAAPVFQHREGKTYLDPEAFQELKDTLRFIEKELRLFLSSLSMSHEGNAYESFNRQSETTRQKIVEAYTRALQLMGLPVEYPDVYRMLSNPSIVRLTHRQRRKRGAQELGLLGMAFWIRNYVTALEKGKKTAKGVLVDPTRVNAFTTAPPLYSRAFNLYVQFPMAPDGVPTYRARFGNDYTRIAKGDYRMVVSKGTEEATADTEGVSTTKQGQVIPFGTTLNILPNESLAGRVLSAVIERVPSTPKLTVVNAGKSYPRYIDRVWSTMWFRGMEYEVLPPGLREVTVELAAVTGNYSFVHDVYFWHSLVWADRRWDGRVDTKELDKMSAAEEHAERMMRVALSTESREGKTAYGQVGEDAVLVEAYKTLPTHSDKKRILYTDAPHYSTLSNAYDAETRVEGKRLEEVFAEDPKKNDVRTVRKAIRNVLVRLFDFPNNKDSVVKTKRTRHMRFLQKDLLWSVQDEGGKYILWDAPAKEVLTGDVKDVVKKFISEEYSVDELEGVLEELRTLLVFSKARTRANAADTLRQLQTLIAKAKKDGKDEKEIRGMIADHLLENGNMYIVTEFIRHGLYNVAHTINEDGEAALDEKGKALASVLDAMSNYLANKVNRDQAIDHFVDGARFRGLKKTDKNRVVGNVFELVVMPEVHRMYAIARGVRSRYRYFHQIGKLFLAIPEFNEIRWKGRRVVELIAEDPEKYNEEWFEKHIAPEMMRALARYIDDKVTHTIQVLEEKGVVETDEEGRIVAFNYGGKNEIKAFVDWKENTLGVFNQLNEELRDPALERLVKVASSTGEKGVVAKDILARMFIYDYVMTSMVTNAEYVRGAAGSMALWADKKVMRKHFPLDNKTGEYDVFKLRTSWEALKKDLYNNLWDRLTGAIAPAWMMPMDETSKSLRTDGYKMAVVRDLEGPVHNIGEVARKIFSKDELTEDEWKAIDLLQDAIDRKSGGDAVARAITHIQNVLTDEHYAKIEPYLNATITDGIVYETVPHRLEMLYRRGKIDFLWRMHLLEKYQKQLEDIEEYGYIMPANQYTKDELKQLHYEAEGFGPVKPRYYGIVPHRSGDSVVAEVFYEKSSSVVLIPQVTLGYELDKVRRMMEKAGIDRLLHESALKSGQLDKVIDIYDTDGKVMELSEEHFKVYEKDGTVMKMPWYGFGIQQIEKVEDPNRFGDHHGVIGSQVTRFMFALEAVRDAVIRMGDKEISGDEAAKMFQELLRKLMLLREARLRNVHGTLGDPQAVLRAMLDVVSQIRVHRDVKKFIEAAIEENVQGVTLIPFAQSFESVLMAAIHKAVQRFNFPTYHVRLVSPAGMVPDGVTGTHALRFKDGKLEEGTRHSNVRRVNNAEHAARTRKAMYIDEDLRNPFETTEEYYEWLTREETKLPKDMTEEELELFMKKKKILRMIRDASQGIHPQREGERFKNAIIYADNEKDYEAAIVLATLMHQNMVKNRVLAVDRDWDGKLKVTEDGEVEVLVPAELLKAKRMTKDDKGNLVEETVELFIEKNGLFVPNPQFVEVQGGRLVVKEGAIADEALKTFSFRIPTSRHNYTHGVKIVGILPPEAGRRIVMPAEVNVKEDSDFDADTEHIYVYHLYVDRGTIKVLDEAMANRWKPMSNAIATIEVDEEGRRKVKGVKQVNPLNKKAEAKIYKVLEDIAEEEPDTLIADAVRQMKEYNRLRREYEERRKRVNKLLRALGYIYNDRTVNWNSRETIARLTKANDSLRDAEKAMLGLWPALEFVRYTEKYEQAKTQEEKDEALEEIFDRGHFIIDQYLRDAVVNMEQAVEHLEFLERQAENVLRGFAEKKGEKEGYIPTEDDLNDHNLWVDSSMQEKVLVNNIIRMMHAVASSPDTRKLFWEKRSFNALADQAAFFERFNKIDDVDFLSPIAQGSYHARMQASASLIGMSANFSTLYYTLMHAVVEARKIKDPKARRGYLERVAVSSFTKGVKAIRTLFGVEGYDFYGEERSRSGNNIHDMIAEALDAAVDERKHHILQRNNITNETLGAVIAMLARGYDMVEVDGKKYYIPLLVVNAPIIRAYTAKRARDRYNGIYVDETAAEFEQRLMEEAVAENSDSPIGTFTSAAQAMAHASAVVGKIEPERMLRYIETGEGVTKEEEWALFKVFTAFESEGREFMRVSELIDIDRPMAGRGWAEAVAWLLQVEELAARHPEVLGTLHPVHRHAPVEGIIIERPLRRYVLRPHNIPGLYVTFLYRVLKAVVSRTPDLQWFYRVLAAVHAESPSYSLSDPFHVKASFRAAVAFLQSHPEYPFKERSDEEARQYYEPDTNPLTFLEKVAEIRRRAELPPDRYPLGALHRNKFIESLVFYGFKGRTIVAFDPSPYSWEELREDFWRLYDENPSLGTYQGRPYDARTFLSDLMDYSLYVRSFQSAHSPARILFHFPALKAVGYFEAIRRLFAELTSDARARWLLARAVEQYFQHHPWAAVETRRKEMQRLAAVPSHPHQPASQPFRYLYIAPQPFPTFRYEPRRNAPHKLYVKVAEVVDLRTGGQVKGIYTDVPTFTPPSRLRLTHYEFHRPSSVEQIPPSFTADVLTDPSLVVRRPGHIPALKASLADVIPYWSAGRYICPRAVADVLTTEWRQSRPPSSAEIGRIIAFTQELADIAAAQGVVVRFLPTAQMQALAPPSQTNTLIQGCYDESGRRRIIYLNQDLLPGRNLHSSIAELLGVFIHELLHAAYAAVEEPHRMKQLKKTAEWKAVERLRRRIERRYRKAANAPSNPFQWTDDERNALQMALCLDTETTEADDGRTDEFIAHVLTCPHTAAALAKIPYSARQTPSMFHPPLRDALLNRFLQTPDASPPTRPSYLVPVVDAVAALARRIQQIVQSE